MTVEQKLDYMIQSLQVAKDEIKYTKDYQSQKEQDANFYDYGHSGYNTRSPNGTLMRESLKMVGRMANIVASDITLTPYCDNLFKQS